MSLQDKILSAIERYWADFFGCSPTVFGRDTPCVVPHAALGSYRGIWLFGRANALVVSLPVPEYEIYHRAFAHTTVAALHDHALVPALLDGHIDQIIGPASIGYADASTFKHGSEQATRLLTPADAAAYEAFRTAIPPVEWSHGGSDWDSEPLVGTYDGDRLVALAGYERWGTTIAHICIVTHPAYRGRGYGRRAVSLLTHVALERDLIPQYRTLQANTSSQALATALGFRHYADQVAIRLKQP